MKPTKIIDQDPDWVASQQGGSTVVFDVVTKKEGHVRYCYFPIRGLARAVYVNQFTGVANEYVHTRNL